MNSENKSYWLNVYLHQVSLYTEVRKWLHHKLVVVTLSVHKRALFNNLKSIRVSSPENSRSWATVKAELHMAVHQSDGQEVAAVGVLAVEQGSVGCGGPEGDLKLGEGQVVALWMRPGGASVRQQRLVEVWHRQPELWEGHILVDFPTLFWLGAKNMVLLSHKKIKKSTKDIVIKLLEEPASPKPWQQCSSEQET